MLTITIGGVLTAVLLLCWLARNHIRFYIAIAPTLFQLLVVEYRLRKPSKEIEHDRLQKEA